MRHLRIRPATLILAIALLPATAAVAQAQTTTTQPTPTTTVTTSPASTGPCLPVVCSSTTSPSTTAPPGKKPPTAAPPTTSPSPLPGDGVVPPGTPQVVPPDAQRQIDSVRRTGPNNTEAWLAAIQPLVTEFGMTPTDAAIAGAGHFPVAGATTWVDDWLYPRYFPTFHLHKGLDLFAAQGTPVRAPFDGVLKFSDGAVGGLAAYVTMSDGTYCYMAHLAGFAPGKVAGQTVRQGEVVGFVGATGDAQGGAPHVHFQLHPKGGNPVPPKPTVDGWLAEATAAAPQLIANMRAARNPAAGPEASASVTAVTESPPSVPAETLPELDPASALWAASSNPTIGTVDLASSLVASAADDIRWPQPPR